MEEGSGGRENEGEYLVYIPLCIVITKECVSSMFCLLCQLYSSMPFTTELS